MKKKLLLVSAAVFAAAIISLSSCGGSPANKAVNFFKEATEQVKNAKTIDELEEIEEKLEDQLDKLEDSAKDFKPTEEEQQALVEAADDFQKEWRQAKRNLRGR